MKRFLKILAVAIGLYLVYRTWQKVRAGLSLVDAVVAAVSELPRRIGSALMRILRLLNPYNLYQAIYALGRAVASIFIDGRTAAGAVFDFQTDIIDITNGQASTGTGPIFSAPAP